MKKYTQEILLNLEEQYPEKIKDFEWFFEKINSKEGSFMRNNEEIKKSISIYEDLIDTFDFILSELKEGMK